MLTPNSAVVLFCLLNKKFDLVEFRVTEIIDLMRIPKRSFQWLPFCQFFSVCLTWRRSDCVNTVFVPSVKQTGRFDEVSDTNQVFTICILFGYWLDQISRCRSLVHREKIIRVPVTSDLRQYTLVKNMDLFHLWTILTQPLMSENAVRILHEKKNMWQKEWELLGAPTSQESSWKHHICTPLI